MWGTSFCRNTLGPPISLWTTGTVSRQFVLSVHCVKFVSVTSSMPLSVSLSLWAATSSDECLSGSDYTIGSVTSHSTRFLLVAKLVAVHNSAHNKHNAYWIGPHFKSLHYLDSCMLLLWQPSCWTVELEIVMEHYNSRNSRRNPYNRMKSICFWSYICTTHWKELLYVFLSSPTECIWTVPQHTDKPELPRDPNVTTRLKPKQRVREYNNMYSQLQISLHKISNCNRSYLKTTNPANET
jgi:hypothetical protein